MSETTSRRLFLAQFVLLVAPALAIFAVYAVLGGGAAASMLIAFDVSSLPPNEGSGDRDGALAMLGTIGLGIVIPALGLAAIILLCRVSFRFWRNGRAGLRASRAMVWTGGACAVAPLAFMAPIGFMATAGGEGWAYVVCRAYLSGLVLLPALAHLTWEMLAPTLRRD